MSRANERRQRGLIRRFLRAVRWRRVALMLGMVFGVLAAVLLVFMWPRIQWAAAAHAIEEAGGQAGGEGASTKSMTFVGLLGPEYAAPPSFVRLGRKTDDALLREIMPELNAVEHLCVSDTGITDEGLAQLSTLESVRDIEFWRHGNITGRGLRCLKDIPSLRYVTFLEYEITPEHAKSLAECTQLESVIMVECQTTDEALLPLASLTNLRELAFSSPSIDGDSLAICQNMHKLKRLFVSGVGDEQLAYIAEISSLRHLAPGDNITDAGLVHLEGLVNLESLALSRSQITDAGLRHLAKLPNLTELWLNGTAITDEGVKELARFPKLKTLWLNDTQITDASVPVLKSMQLEQLEFDGTQITEEGRQRLWRK